MKATTMYVVAALALVLAGSAMAQAKPLRLLSWADYVPTEVKEQFERETGYKVEVTLSSNDDMVARLRNTTTPAFDLAQPSLERLAGAQKAYKIYKPLDPARVRTDLLLEAPLAAARKYAALDGKLYGVPHVWGTDGLVVNTRLAKISNYPDLCKPEVKGKTTMRLRRTTLLAFAFAAGRNPFALYDNPKAYGALMDDVGKTLIACKANLRMFWDSRDQLLANLRVDDIVGALMWDTGGWKLQGERPEIAYIAPAAGALGWMDTYALPARGGNDDAAYAWINFNLRPEIAAKVAQATGNVTGSRGAIALMDDKFRTRFEASFPPAALANIKWYPPAPPDVEEIEARVLERIRAANGG